MRKFCPKCHTWKSNKDFNHGKCKLCEKSERDKRNKRISFERIHATITEETGIHIIGVDVFNSDRTVIEARQIAMYLIRKLIQPKPTSGTVGKYFGKDHATVLYACKTIKNHIDTEKEFCQMIDRIEKKLLS